MTRLQTQRLGRPLIWLDEIGSTNEHALQLGSDGAQHGTTVVALRQTGGRGRLGRAWASPEGGVWVSVVLRPERPPAALLSLGCGLAACEAIEAVSGRVARLKWPNDIILDGPPGGRRGERDGRKAGGVLLESRYVGSRGFLVAGIGINAAVDPAQYDASLRGIATAVGTDDIRTELLAALLLRLEAEHSIEAIRQRCETLGRRVRVVWESGQVEGLAEAIDDAGGLQVRPADGQPQTIWSCQALTYC